MRMAHAYWGVVAATFPCAMFAADVMCATGPLAAAPSLSLKQALSSIQSVDLFDKELLTITPAATKAFDSRKVLVDGATPSLPLGKFPDIKVLEGTNPIVVPKDMGVLTTGEIQLPQTPLNVQDKLTKLTIGRLPLSASPYMQLDPVFATDEAKRFQALITTPAEAARLAQSSACQAAYKELYRAFVANRESMEFWTDGEASLNHFIPWYYQASEESRQKAAPVVRAQEEFDKACLEQAIPDEVNPALVRNAVGILKFEDKVFCTGLRETGDGILTARHCFVDSSSGKWTKDAEAVRAGKAKMWFVYEGEPQHRFEVCRDSLATNEAAQFPPDRDNIRVRIAKTSASVAPIKWASLPLVNGASLYLRGYFPFTGASSDLGRMRSTAAGGCVAHSGAEMCFFHSCQTTPIMSGAPVFTRPEPGSKREYLEVAGLHLGSALLAAADGENGSVCTGINGRNVSSSNFAYQPPRKPSQ